MRTIIKENTHVYGVENKVRLDCSKGGKKSKSKARQEFKDSSDINKIIKKYNVTGVLNTGDVVSDRKPMFGDYEGIDYQETCNKIAKVEQDFMKQPADVRAKFDNEPQGWLAQLEKDEIQAIVDAEALKIKEAAQNPADAIKADEGTRESQTGA